MVIFDDGCCDGEMDMGDDKVGVLTGYRDEFNGKSNGEIDVTSAVGNRVGEADRCCMDGVEDGSVEGIVNGMSDG